ncbi:hypothetical protein MACJ_003685 [Theileria orientalis]|uniref:Uncharacterized protein n=1 Tax=Theileria orientalis TaxID=68886 RepID=A0A976SL66_THEOR|nr:hypothetical protein MACJ_003685 [Theileria orientalis]
MLLQLQLLQGFIYYRLRFKSSTGYKYDRSHDIISFTASSGYSFNAVKEKSEEKSKDESKEDSKDKGVEGTKAESEDDSNIIWKTDKKEEYATKVTASIYEGIVTIFKDANGTSKIVFKKGSDGKWKEDTQASTPKSTTNGSGGGTTQQSKQAT